MPAVRQAQEKGFRINVVDVSRDRATIIKQKLRGVPTFVRFENGHEANRNVGPMSATRLEEFCRGL